MNWQPYQMFTSRKQLLTRLALLASLTICLISNMAGTSEAQRKATQKKSATAKEARYKAIWEPINYKEGLCCKKYTGTQKYCRACGYKWR